MARVLDVIARIEPHDSVERYTSLRVEVKEGFARIVDPWTVEITLNNGDVEQLTTRAIVIAGGAKPFVLSLPGLENVGYLTSDTLWSEFASRDNQIVWLFSAADRSVVNSPRASPDLVPE